MPRTRMSRSGAAAAARSSWGPSRFSAERAVSAASAIRPASFFASARRPEPTGRARPSRAWSALGKSGVSSSRPLDEPSIIVAVCTNRPVPSVEPSLREISAQIRSGGGRGLVVANAVGAEHLSAFEALAAELGLDCVAEPAPGLSNARNRAIAAAGADVVAFVDDDAIPAPGWLGNLAGQWRAAASDVATIGGAIDPVWADPPPEWMSPEIGIAFSLLDRGEDTLPLRPGVEDAWGANVSFRVGAVREVGGFDPGIGSTAGSPLFADETELQLRLAKAGYRGLYAGDVRVGHVVAKERMR